MYTRILSACLVAGVCIVLGLVLARPNQAAPQEKPGVGDKAGADGKSAKVDQAPSEEETALHKAAANYSAAFAKGDVEAVLSMWTPDAEFIDDDGKAYRGRDALSPLFTKSLPSFKGYKVTSKLTSVRFVKPDVALVDGDQTFTPPRGEPDISRFTSVWVKTDGQWRIRSARDLAPEPAGESVAGRRLRELEWLVGEWASEGNTPVHVRINWNLNKAFLTMDYEVKLKDGGTSKVVQWVGWDPLTDQIKSWVFDDHGGYGEALWTRNGNTWTANSTGVLPDGGLGSSINLLKYQDDKMFVWQSQRREADGQPLPDVEVKFTRQANKP